MRGQDLEVNGVENVWVEIYLGTKRILLCIFYTPPSASRQYDSSIEGSLQLAVDTNLENIIIVGEFNRNMLSLNSLCLITTICTQSGMT